MTQGDERVILFGQSISNLLQSGADFIMEQKKERYRKDIMRRFANPMSIFFNEGGVPKNPFEIMSTYQGGIQELLGSLTGSKSDVEHVQLAEQLKSQMVGGLEQLHFREENRKVATGVEVLNPEAAKVLNKMDLDYGKIHPELFQGVPDEYRQPYKPLTIDTGSTIQVWTYDKSTGKMKLMEEWDKESPPTRFTHSTIKRNFQPYPAPYQQQREFTLKDNSKLLLSWNPQTNQYEDTEGNKVTPPKDYKDVTTITGTETKYQTEVDRIRQENQNMSAYETKLRDHMGWDAKRFEMKVRKWKRIKSRWGDAGLFNDEDFSEIWNSGDKSAINAMLGLLGYNPIED